MPFLIAGILFAVARLFATRPLPPIIGFMAGSHTWIKLARSRSAGLLALRNAVLRECEISESGVSLGLSLLHLLITLSAVFGLGQLHYIGMRTEQGPTSYNPALAFLGSMLLHCSSSVVFCFSPSSCVHGY